MPYRTPFLAVSGQLSAFTLRLQFLFNSCARWICAHSAQSDSVHRNQAPSSMPMATPIANHAPTCPATMPNPAPSAAPKARPHPACFDLFVITSAPPPPRLRLRRIARFEGFIADLAYFAEQF